MNRIQYVLFFVVVSIAGILRFWNLSVIPPSLSHDEVAIGFNAWSILQTGKDEYGVSHPVLFKSFDDYKLPGYIYLTSLSEKIFGLNEFAVRFPSAFLGLLTVPALYFLVKEVFEKYKKEQGVDSGYKEKIALFSTLLLAVSPWHINFSRAAFETNGSLFFVVLAVFALFKSIKKPHFFILALISSVVAVYFYYTARIVLPIIILVFILIYRKELLAVKKWVILSFLLAFILLLPILPQMFTSGLSRINQVSIFEDKSLTNPYSEAIVRNNNSLFSKAIYNRRVAYMQEFFDNYLKNFAPDFYFTNGTGPMGLLYLWEAPFLLYGFYSVLKMKNRWKWIIFVWFFSVPLVGGLTTQQPNALRTLANAPVAAFFSAVGLYGFLNKFSNNQYFKIIIMSFSVIVMFFFVRFLVLYFDYYPRLTASNWGDGHKQMADFVMKSKNNYDNVYITGDYWRPYIYMLFYSGYPPSNYQKNGSISKFSNIHFGKAIWDRLEGIDFARADLSKFVVKKTLFILSSNDFTTQNSLIETEFRPYHFRLIKQIDGNFANGVFYAVVMR